MGVTHEPGVGFRIGGYSIIDTLGHGAMAKVFLAEDSNGHEVALKVFREGAGVSTTMLERFRREIEATKKLRRHPYILTVYTTGQDGMYHYIAMEYVPGSRTFEDVLMQDELSIDQILRIGVKLGSALGYAHENGIIHRDVKPSNIMIDEFGEPLLGDFGVAELVDWPSVTVSGALMGTPAYMAPEQARAERVGREADIYTLSVVLYEALTGCSPYQLSDAPDTKEVLEAVRSTLPIKPRRLNPSVSMDLEYALLRALSKDPKDRYPSVNAFAHDLGSIVEGRPVTARFFSVSYGVRHFLRRRRSGILITATALLLGSASYMYVQHILQGLHSEQLLSLARLRNADFVLMELNQSGGGGPVSRSDQEMRMGRKALLSQNFDEARLHFKSAAALSVAFRDERQAAISHLELARCEILLMDDLRAKELFMEILSSDDASPAVKTVSHFEFVMLLIMNNVPEEAIEMAERFETQEEGPYRYMIDYLVGRMKQTIFLEKISHFPERFKNDGYLSLAIRCRFEGDAKSSELYMNKCIRSSTPRHDWPVAWARHMSQRGAL